MSILRRIFGSSPPGVVIDAAQFAAKGRKQRLDIVGESHYQANFLKLTGPKTEESRRIPVKVELVHEPANPKDRLAVAAMVNGLLLGYLPREQAQQFHAWLAALGHASHKARLVNLDGTITGGWSRDADEGTFGLELRVSPYFAQWFDTYLLRKVSK